MQDLLRQLRSWQPFRAIVVGDFMLDQYLYGAAERMSPDAPVPVLHATRQDDRPGGASNVCQCLRALNAHVQCFGVVGDDLEAKILCRTLADEGCDVKGLIVDSTRPTTIKRSMVGLAQHRHPQKMFRVDLEAREPLSETVRDQLLVLIEAQLAAADVVCLEDYNKGVCTTTLCQRLIEMCRQAGKPVLVDPAAIENYDKYHGATAITPNRTEAELVTGLDTPEHASELHNSTLAMTLREQLDLDAVVLTLDRHGALLDRRDVEPVHVPTMPREVYDVSGAGDMVLAALAGAIANHIDWHNAVHFANAAAGLEVEQFGVRPIPLAQVQREVLRQMRPLNGKVRTRDELVIELDAHRAVGDRIVLTNGCFDVIHAGHVAYLREAKQQGDVLVVAINSDKQVRVQKGEGRPVYPAAQRLEILSEFNCIDYLIEFEEPTAHALLRIVMPDLYVKGGDYENQSINEADVLDELGIETRLLAHRPGLSSTSVIERAGVLPER